MHKNRTLTQWLTLLENRHGDINYDLKHVSVVGERLHVTSFKPTVICVAGTNGKGSTVATLEAIYDQAGYRVASYTSPHLFRFNERIRLQTKPADDSIICHAFSAVESARGTLPLSYFEMSTLAALWIFKQLSLDVILLEVGMGGRLDATNIVDHDLCIITSIALDHQAYLGNDLESIGREKAGIIRAKKPLIYADEQPPNSVLEKACELEASVSRLGVDFEYHSDGEYFTAVGKDWKITCPEPTLHLKAVTAAIEVTQSLSDVLPVSNEAIQTVLPNLSCFGRWEFRINSGVFWIFDVAHNPQAAEALRDKLDSLPKGQVCHVIYGAMQDKDILNTVRPLANCAQIWYPTLLEDKRSATEVMIVDSLNKLGLKHEACFSHPTEACKAVKQRVKPGDMVIVYGSFMTVAPTLKMMDELEAKCLGVYV